MRLQSPPPPSARARFRARPWSWLAVVSALLAIPVSGAGLPWHRPPWRDFDHNSRTTRTDLLLARCSHVTLSPAGSSVRHATCPDLYSGREVATDTAAASIQIDHLFPASVAWRARLWYQEDGHTICTSSEHCYSFDLFFNDTAHLYPVRSRTNVQKSDLTPANWCPYSPAARRTLAPIYRSIAARYRLPLSTGDDAALTLWSRGECKPGSRVLGID